MDTNEYLVNGAFLASIWRVNSIFTSCFETLLVAKSTQDSTTVTPAKTRNPVSKTSRNAKCPEPIKNENDRGVRPPRGGPTRRSVQHRIAVSAGPGEDEDASERGINGRQAISTRRHDPPRAIGAEARGISGPVPGHVSPPPRLGRLVGRVPLPVRKAEKPPLPPTHF